ncbi:MAG: RHS repeat protein [Bacteroidales bacterium]|nr:RHS repeat protein [Bacteroidales bacterium]
MKRYIIVLILALVYRFATAQDEVALPSPNAFQFTKYGNIPVNEATGKISPSIPIYEYIAGKLKMPISLSYVGNGVKVDQMCSWTGINWNLNAGGVITRVVRDTPDEIAHQLGKRVYNSEAEYDAKDWTDGSPFITFLNSTIADHTYDTQVDIFQFNFNGYSGSFYLDKNLNCVLTNYEEELTISVTEFNDEGITSFEVKTPEGIIYYFGGAEVEKTRTPNVKDNKDAYTAYYLTKVHHPIGDEIDLEYVSVDAYDKLVYQSYQIRKQIYTGMSGQIEYDGGDDLNVQDSDEVLNKITGGRYLLRISSTRSNIVLYFDSHSTPAGSKYERVMDKIRLVDNVSNTTIKTVDFTYIEDIKSNVMQRFFLEEVIFTGKNVGGKTPTYKYKLEYNNPTGLPKVFSCSQDHLGYYNGVNNTTLLPKTTAAVFKYLNGELADREPRFGHAIMGSLHRIYYPTGGFTEFEYEAPFIVADDPDDIPTNERVQMGVYFLSETDQKLVDTYLISSEFNDEMLTRPGVYMDQDINVAIRVTAEGSVNHHYIITCRLVDITDGINNPISTVEEKFNLSYQVYNYDRFFTFSLLQGHVYKLFLELDPNSSAEIRNAKVYVDASFNYYRADPVVPNGGLGIRVKRIFDYENENALPIIRRYYYKTAEKIGEEKESSVQGLPPNPYYYELPYTALDVPEYDPWHDSPGFIPTTSSYTVAYLQSSSLNSLFPIGDNAYYYNTVTISLGGDNFENGGIQKDFRWKTATYNYPKLIPEQYNSENANILYYEFQRNNDDMYNGKVIKETYLVKDNSGKLCKKKEVTYNYSTGPYQCAVNFLAKRIFRISELTPTLHLNDANSSKGLYLGFYKTFTKRNDLISVTNKEYVIPLSISLSEEDPQNIIKSETYSTYSWPGIPVRVIESTSKEDKVIETRNYYSNSTSLSGLSTEEQACYNSLFSNHILSRPIQVETYLMDKPVEFNDTIDPGEYVRKKLSTTRTIYNNELLPAKVQRSFADNALTDEIYFTNYDDFGNPTEIAKTDNISTVYIWGYNNTQPIAKIDNIKETDLGSAINTLIDEACTISDSENTTAEELSLRNKLNQIRINLPAFARITTYTYDLPFGATSITDPNGITTFYEYDGFGRLKYVKDHDGNILKSHEYHYQE